MLLLPLLLTLNAHAADLAAARAAERAGDPELERSICMQLEAEPACQQRLSYLAARQDSDGSLQALSRLEAARRGADQDIAEIARTHPSLELRVDAGLWMASRSQGQEALEWTEPLWLNLEPGHPERPRVGRAQVRALTELGRLEEAQTVEQSWATHIADRPNEGVAVALTQARRLRLAMASGAILLLTLLLSLRPALRTWRSGPAPKLWGLLPLWISGLLAAAVAGLWDAESGLTLLLCLAPLSALHAASALALRDLNGFRKGALRLLSGLSTLALIFLLFWWRAGLEWLRI